MEDVVAAFNASQTRIEVRYSAVSQIDLKLMLAIAGNRPPDVAGLWSFSIPAYVENNALRPLGGFAKAQGIEASQYLDSVWTLCRYQDWLWALPATPSSLALHWNKKLFREAGLDPDKPPASIAELEKFNEQISQREPGPGRGWRVLGHLPEEPGWWRSMWGYWFGGTLWDGVSRITADSEANRRALAWIQSCPRHYGLREVSGFLEGFGNFASPQNAFIQNRVAMVLQGPWMWNFLKKYGSGDFELGVAAFPREDGGKAPVTIVETDVLVIPAGAKHPREAFEFIRFVNQQQNIERLCAAQCKFSPLTTVSDAFWEKHPHPQIRVFYDLARSPAARAAPQLATWSAYRNELDQAVKETWALRAAPENAMRGTQARMQAALDKRLSRWSRLEPKLAEAWIKTEAEDEAAGKDTRSDQLNTRVSQVKPLRAGRSGGEGMP